RSLFSMAAAKRSRTGPASPGDAIDADAESNTLSTRPDHLDSWQPRVHARFSNGLPFLVERRIGEGRVVLVASGVFSSPSGQGWNTLPLTDAMLVFDRLLRSMIESTLLQ